MEKYDFYITIGLIVLIVFGLVYGHVVHFI